MLFTILLFLTCFSLKRYLSLLVSTSKECLLLLYPVIKYSYYIVTIEKDFPFLTVCEEREKDGML